MFSFGSGKKYILSLKQKEVYFISGLKDDIKEKHTLMEFLFLIPIFNS